MPTNADPARIQRTVHRLCTKSSTHLTPIRHHPAACHSTPGGVSICYSDDHGTSWHSSSHGYGGMSWTEIEVAELSRRGGANNKTPVLYMTIRNDAEGPYPQGVRQMSTSTDSGLTWASQQNVEVRLDTKQTKKTHPLEPLPIFRVGSRLLVKCHTSLYRGTLLAVSRSSLVLSD